MWLSHFVVLFKTWYLGFSQPRKKNHYKNNWRRPHHMNIYICRQILFQSHFWGVPLNRRLFTAIALKRLVVLRESEQDACGHPAVATRLAVVPVSLGFSWRKKNATLNGPSSHRLCFSKWGGFMKIFLSHQKKLVKKQENIIHTSAAYLGSLLLNFYLCCFVLFLFAKELQNGPCDSSLVIFEGNWNRFIPTHEGNVKLSKVGDSVLTPSGSHEAWRWQWTIYYSERNPASTWTGKTGGIVGWMLQNLGLYCP